MAVSPSVFADSDSEFTSPAPTLSEFLFCSLPTPAEPPSTHLDGVHAEIILDLAEEDEGERKRKMWRLRVESLNVFVEASRRWTSFWMDDSDEGFHIPTPR